MSARDQRDGQGGASPAAKADGASSASPKADPLAAAYPELPDWAPAGSYVRESDGALMVPNPDGGGMINHAALKRLGGGQ